ncbi:precorrin-4 C(11)-methyltransferase [Parabacteroides sp.]
MSKNILNILVVSASSLPLARKIRNEYPGKTVIYCKEADNDVEPFTSFEELAGDLFDRSEAMVFIGAMGICVRSIAPYIKSKYTDPAVVCLDSTGKYAVSVLSGHIGGANELTHELARILGAEAVVTTQSDNQGLWALDTLAQQYGWEQDVYNLQEGIRSFLYTDFEETDDETFDASRKKAMNECIARFVNRRPTALLLYVRTEETDYMEKTCPPHVDIFYKYKDIDLEKYDLLITVSPYYYPKSPIPCLSFFPKVLHLGVGCKKGLKDMRSVLIDMYICSNFFGLNLKSIADVSSIALKKDEPILKELANTYLCSPFKTYAAEELDKIPVPNPSSKVKQVTGSGSVSEAAAILSAEGGPLLVEKQKGQTKDFTYAIAISQSAIQNKEDDEQKREPGQGHIEIVGAGPGDPELISIRGRRMLENADLILYAGSLVPKELTLCAKKGATVRSSADMNLEEQFALMKEFYDKGKFVVRLHTGDPCIYGAIQEQMAFFDRYGMSYHITPGISSFQAAAAALRSQFTIPEKVQTIILTRGEGRTPMPEKEQLHKLAASQSTMCIFLSAGIAGQVQKELLEHYPPTTPVAACYKLTWKDERIYRGELKDLERIVKENNLTLTTLLVVGDAIDNRAGASRLYAEEFKHLYRR